MRRELHRGLGLAALVAAMLVAFAPAAQAQSEEHARGLFQQGVELSSQGRWSEAEALFRRSHAEVPRASTAYNLTLALLHLGRGREALDVLSDLSTRYGQDHAYRDQVEALRAHALRLVARLTINVSPQSASLELDGQPIAGDGGTRLLIVDPGEHRVRLSAPGYQPAERVLHTRAAEELSERIQLELEPAPPPAAPPAEPPPAPPPLEPKLAAPPPQEGQTVLWPAIALVGTGAALLATGGVLGVLALDANAELDEVCPDRAQCPPSRHDRVELLHERKVDYAAAADVLFISGAAVASAGIVWWLLAPDEQPPSVTASVAPDGAAVSVRRWF